MSCRIDPEAKSRIDEICRKHGWIYGERSPKLSELMTRIAAASEIEIDGKKFLVIPLE